MSSILRILPDTPTICWTRGSDSRRPGYGALLGLVEPARFRSERDSLTEKERALRDALRWVTLLDHADAIQPGRPAGFGSAFTPRRDKTVRLHRRLIQRRA